MLTLCVAVGVVGVARKTLVLTARGNEVVAVCMSHCMGTLRETFAIVRTLRKALAIAIEAIAVATKGRWRSEAIAIAIEAITMVHKRQLDRKQREMQREMQT